MKIPQWWLEFLKAPAWWLARLLCIYGWAVVAFFLVVAVVRKEPLPVDSWLALAASACLTWYALRRGRPRK